MILKRVSSILCNVLRQEFLISGSSIQTSNKVIKSCCYHSLNRPTAPRIDVVRNDCLPHFFVQRQHYAKGKNKGGKDKGKQVHISDEEMNEAIDVEKMREEYDAAVEKLKDDFFKHLSVRSSLGSLEQIMVEFEGDKYPLNELATIGRKSSAMVVVNSTAFPQATQNIMKAIVNSGMNLNPQQEGTTIYVPIPKITKDHREGLAKNAKTICERQKGIIRDIGNKFVKKASLKEDDLPKDTVYLTTLKIREIGSKIIAEMEQLTKNKQNEILQVGK